MSLMPPRADARNLERKVANQRRALVFASCLRSSKPGARERCEEEAAKVKEEQLLVMDSRTARGVWPADRENLIASRMHRLAEMPFGRATVRSNVWLPGTVEERVAYLDRKFSCDWRVRGRLNFAHSVDCPVSALHARKMGLGQLELFDDALLYAAPDGEGDTDLASLFPWQGEREGEEVGGAPTCPADSIVPRPDPMAWHSTASLPCLVRALPSLVLDVTFSAHFCPRTDDNTVAASLGAIPFMRTLARPVLANTVGDDAWAEMGQEEVREGEGSGGRGHVAGCRPLLTAAQRIGHGDRLVVWFDEPVPNCRVVQLHLDPLPMQGDMLTVRDEAGNWHHVHLPPAHNVTLPPMGQGPPPSLRAPLPLSLSPFSVTALALTMQLRPTAAKILVVHELTCVN
jgi:hypothetical protein